MPAYLQNLSADTQTRTLQLLEALARHVGLLPPLPQGPPPPPPVPTITKSIGTTGRDYSTITAWEADLDNGAIYTSGDTAIGECYDDSAFDEGFTVNGGGTVGLASVTLTAAAGERHDGTAGTGARIVASTARTWILARSPCNLSWLEFDANSFLCTLSTSSVSAGSVLANLLHHELLALNAARAMDFDSAGAGGPNMWLVNTIVYNAAYTNAVDRDIIGVRLSGGAVGVLNLTVHNVRGTHASSVGDATCILATSDSSTVNIRNCVATAPTVAGSGAAACFSPSSPASIVVDHNASSDGSASGTGSLTSIVTADQYVSTTLGSEDLHLKAGADCIDAGTDLGTTPTGVNIDIDGYDRDAGGVTWDIGAHEFISAAMGNRMRRVLCGI